MRVLASSVPVERFPTCPAAPALGHTCKRRSCPVCGLRWARNWYVILSRNLALFDAVVMVTLTAPGADVLPWDELACKHGPGTPCAGKRGCRVQPLKLAEWSLLAPVRWNLLRDAARKAVKREHGVDPPRVLARVWEPQKRGAPHLHLVLPAGRPVDRHATRLFADKLVELAVDYGFGPQSKVNAPQSGASAAKYLASYLTGRNPRKPSVRENISDPNMPASLLWVAPVLTRITALTMRTLRYVRHARAAVLGRCSFPVIHDPNRRADLVRAYAQVYRLDPVRAGP